MFIACKPNIQLSFAGLSAMMKLESTCEAIATSTAALDYFADELRDDLVDDVEIQPRSFNSRSSSGSSTTGSTLKRSVSTIQGAASCSHSNPAQTCIVQAKQIEFDVASLSDEDFWLCIESPNGESSGKLHFTRDGEVQRFSPRAEGCGHGHWSISVFRRNSDGKTFTLVSETQEYLDGVGSLFYTVDENLCVKLAGQEFLRLPSACKTCTSSKKQEKFFKLW